MTLKAQSNSKSGHRNISYDDAKRSYVVSIYHSGRYFRAYLDTLDEAIEIRDRANNFYEKNHFWPTKSDLGLKRRKSRRSKEYASIKQTFVCSVCKREISYYDKERIKAFVENGNACGYCSRKERFNLSLDVELNDPNSLKDKYITQVTKKSGRVSYKVSFHKNQRIIGRSFKSLTEAIEYRDRILDFFKEHSRLPDDSELESIFGLHLINRTLRRSNDLKNDLRNIRYNRKSNKYILCIVRRRDIFNGSFKTLEEAKLARKIVLETYDNTGVMLRVGEVRARMKELGELK